MSQFPYCSLIWMFHNRAIKHRIYRIHEKTLRLIYSNQHQLKFMELLEKNKTVSLHQRNLQTFATEKTRSLLRFKIRGSSLSIKTTILEMYQFLKGRDISQSIMEVKVFYL